MFVLAALLVLLAAVAIFAGQNADLVPVNVLGAHFEWPLAGLVLIALVAGALAAFLVGLFRQLRLRLKIRETGGKLRRSETDFAAAKTELEKAKAELETAKASLAVAQHELEEARRAADGAGLGSGNGNHAAGKGGGPGGPGHGRA